MIKHAVRMLINLYPPPIPGMGRNRPESSSGYLRRQWIRGAWRRSSWSDRLLCVLAAIAWWPIIVLHAAYLAARLGPSRSRLCGKSVMRQFLEQIDVAALWLVPPIWYYIFELYDEERRAHAGDYVQRAQMKTFIYKWLVDRKHRKDPAYPFSNKFYFSFLCRKHGLPTSPVIASAAWNRFKFHDPALNAFPPVDLFIKIKNGRGGYGAEKWCFVDGQYKRGGRSFTGLELVAYLKRRSRFAKRIVQRCLVNHSALADVNLGVLATARILTVRDEKGGTEATHAVFRMPQKRGVAVDNIHAGGIAAPIDLLTGRLGRATDLGVKVGSRWHEHHPETGAMILGRTLPHWPATLDLVKRAHAVIGDRVVVGWDVAILEDGPCLVEGNGKPDVDLIQRPHRAGLGESRYGELIAVHLRNALAGDTRNGRLDVPPVSDNTVGVAAAQ